MPNRAPDLVWDDPAAEPAEPGLRGAAIVRAAIELADAEGLDAVSIRRVAAALGARPMSLYTHIAAKEDLVAPMADAVVGEVVVGDPPAGWRAALRAMAERSWRTFVAHPWLLAASARRRPLGPNALRHAEQLPAPVAPLETPPPPPRAGPPPPPRLGRPRDRERLHARPRAAGRPRCEGRRGPAVPRGRP